MFESLMIGLGVSMGIQLLMFIPAYLFRTDKLTDLSYALTFIILAGILLLLNPVSLPKIVLFTMILVWGLRLGTYLFIRIRKIKRDTRFDDKRSDFWKFLSFWVLQGLTVWLIMFAPVIFFSKTVTNWNYFSILGLSVWAIGLLIETLADYQKYTFKNKNPKKWVSTGLWAYSRHPNYFGEILCWVGVYFFTLSSLVGWELLIGLSTPTYIITTLVFISGLPILEKRYDKKYGRQKAYQKYKSSTSVLVPWFKKK